MHSLRYQYLESQQKSKGGDSQAKNEESDSKCQYCDDTNNVGLKTVSKYYNFALLYFEVP